MSKERAARNHGFAARSVGFYNVSSETSGLKTDYALSTGVQTCMAVAARLAHA